MWLIYQFRTKFTEMFDGREISSNYRTEILRDEWKSNRNARRLINECTAETRRESKSVCCLHTRGCCAQMTNYSLNKHSRNIIMNIFSSTK